MSIASRGMHAIAVELADGSTVYVAPVVSGYIIRVVRGDYVFGVTPGEANKLARALSEAAAHIDRKKHRYRR